MSDESPSVILSGACLSEQPDGLAPGPSEPPPSSDHRYRDRTLLGAGQTGRVERAYDVLLRRHVAMKVLRADASASTRARFEREATITAGLEHPGIVTVHDSGRLLDGRPYYTMQLVRGRSLAERLQGPSAPGGPWLDRFAALCDAVGYAHDCGIVHRDLKPANVMVGDFGEVVVVDWGLATRARASVDEPADETLPVSEPELTVAGTLLGTPLYMSPEQAAGERLDARSDVWSLGVMLHELLVGRHPLAGLSSRVVLARLRQGELPPLDGAAAGLAPELVAIVTRATALRPDDRYPTARQMAEDVQRLLQGQRVAAYSYRPRELLWRFVSAWRRPLLAGAIGLTALGGTLVASNARIRAERDRAREAELVAVEQREEAVALSAQLLAEQARIAAAQGSLAEAEALAGAALARAESPVARGVLAFTGFAIEPESVVEHPAPCAKPRVSTHGLDLLCIDGREVSSYRVGELRPRWSVSLDAPVEEVSVGDLDEPVVLSTTGPTLWVVDREGAVRSIPTTQIQRPISTGEAPLLEAGARLLELDPAGALRTVDVPCGSGLLHATRTDGRPLVLCRGPEVYVDGRALELPAGSGLELASSIATLPDGRVAVGRDDGGLSVLDPTTGGLRTHEVDARRVTQVTALGSELLAIKTEARHVLLWDLREDAAALRLPPSWGDQIRRRPDGTFVSVGAAVRTWSLPRERFTHRFRSDDGLAAATMSHDGTMVAACEGGGELSLWSTQTGRLLGRRRWSEGVLKSAAFSPDDREIVAVSSVDGRPRVLSTEDLQEVHVLQASGGGAGARRVLVLADGSVWRLPYLGGLERWPSLHDAATGRSFFADAWTTDASASQGLRHAAFLGRDGTIWVAHAGQVEPEPLGAVPGADAVDIDDAGTTLVIATDDAVMLLDATLDERRRWEHPTAKPIDVSIAGDGSRVAAGSRDGSVTLWDVATGRVLMHHTGHVERVATVELSDDSMLTASWDRTVHRWALAPVLAPRAAVATDLRPWDAGASRDAERP